jgi:predicted SnoaL-like aldol condensation-catalyzing enzyme
LIRIFVLLLTLGILAWAHAEPNLANNKRLVRDFYEQVFVRHQAKEGAEKYLSEAYRQHNPFVATGRQAFIDFFVPFFQKNPAAGAEIKRIIAEDDLVTLHVHSRINEKDRGRAVVDIFRVENGKIVEHWDVGQPIPEKSENHNTMF